MSGIICTAIAQNEGVFAHRHHSQCKLPVHYKPLKLLNLLRGFMNSSNNVAAVLLAAAFPFGLLGHYLFNGHTTGLNVTLFIWMLTVSSLTVRYMLRRRLSRLSLCLAGFAFWLSLAFSLYESPELLGLNGLGLLLIAVMGLTPKVDVWRYQFVPLARTVLRLPFTPIFALAALLPNALKQRQPLLANPNVASVAKGVVWAIPLLFIFGYLLKSSDRRFGDLVERLFYFDIAHWPSALFFIIFFFCISATVLYFSGLGSLNSKNTRKGGLENTNVVIDGLQINTIMSCINFLFASYLAVQFTYFFGGDKLVVSTKGITYSSYARQGFWDLVWVAMIALPLLYAASLRMVESQSKKYFHYQLLFMIAAIALMEASAAHRMYLYVSQYQLTALRFYSTWFMCFVVSCLAILLYVTFSNRMPYFIVSVLVSALCFIGGLNVINPDAFIARSHIGKMQGGKTPDNDYLRRLSLDAYPVISGYAKDLNRSPICLFPSVLQRYHWQEYSYAYWQARKIQSSGKVEQCQR